MTQIVPRYLLENLLIWYLKDEKFIPELREGFKYSYPETMIYGFGFEGLRDNSQTAQNIWPFYPLTRLTSKFNKKVAELTIPDEYQAFLDKYDTVSLIAFGTTFMPLPEEMERIVEAIQFADTKTTGFIISLKENDPSYAKIAEINLPNVFLSKWVPQKELLNSPKVKLFMSHGGANSVMESVYFGTPLLGFGQNAD